MATPGLGTTSRGCPFAPTPHEARVDGDAAALIADLSALPGVTVGVITGRPRELVEDLPPRFPSVVFAAEHGVWRCAHNGPWESALPAIRELGEIEASLRALAARHTGAIVERKSCSGAASRPTRTISCRPRPR